MKNNLVVAALFALLLFGCKTQQREQPAETLATKAFTNVVTKLGTSEEVIVVDDKNTGLINCREGYTDQHLILEKLSARPEEQVMFNHICRSNIVLKTEYERKPLLAFEEWHFKTPNDAKTIQLRLNVLQANLSAPESADVNIHFKHWVVDNSVHIVYTRNENGRAYVSTLFDVIKK